MAEVFMMVQGEVTMICGSESRLLRAGDLMLVSPGEEHEMRNESEFPAEYIVFGVSKDQGGKTIVV
jgi:mannose-6-phosphate isomerase-like protein (cupin superfamily)